ncbi:MAG: serine protease [Acidimicrobiales bacterium]
MNTALARAAAGLAIGLTFSVAPSVVTAAPTWAPAATAAIHPGVQTTSPAGQCTANFVFSDTADKVYIGQAAHCTTTGGSTGTNGCLTGSLALGTPVTVGGASRPGVMVYNSWLAMRAAGETDPDACAYNDFALVRIDPADAGHVNPSVPHWGGPAVGTSPGTAFAEPVYSYGSSSLRLGLTQLSPKPGLSLGDSGGGWSHTVYTVSPGIPGDSGSAVLDASGRALGVLSTVAVLLLPGSNGVGDLRHELDYLNAHRPSTLPSPVQLALGTEPFNPGRLPLAL